MPLHGWEILVVLVVILIIFGPGKLPQVFGALGKGLREFRKAKSGEEDASPKQLNKSEETDEEKES